MDRNGINSYAGLNYTINHFSTPSLYKNEKYFDDMMKERSLAFREIGSFINDGRLIILDSEDGRSFEFMSTTLRLIRENNPSKRIFYFLDNLHLLTSEAWSENGPERIKKLSHETKALAVNTNSCIISTVELRKLQKGQKADNNDLAGSASLSYDANGIVHLYSELDVDPTSLKHFRHGNSIRKNPVVEVNISKNKIASYKGLLYAKLYASQAYYEFISEELYKALYDDNDTSNYASNFSD